MMWYIILYITILLPAPTFNVLRLCHLNEERTISSSANRKARQLTGLGFGVCCYFIILVIGDLRLLVNLFSAKTTMHICRRKFPKNLHLFQNWIKCFPEKNLVKSRGKLLFTWPPGTLSPSVFLSSSRWMKVLASRQQFLYQQLTQYNLFESPNILLAVIFIPHVQNFHFPPLKGTH